MHKIRGKKNVLQFYSLFSHIYMGSFTLLILSLLASSVLLAEIEAQGIKSARLLDLLIRDYTFKSYDTQSGTGIPHTVHLPSNFSGIKVNTVRYRCGSLRRYGANVSEFHIGSGVIVHPCVERVVVVGQNLGHNWSTKYYSNYDLSGYQLASPVLGLLAYNAGKTANFSNPFELGIHAVEKPILIDFSNTTRVADSSGSKPLCASFESDGNVTIKNPISPYICVATRNGHYGLVIESSPSSPPSVEVDGRNISRWKVAMGSSVGAAIGAFLLGLLLVAMFVKAKKKLQLEEMERRAYEEEALQVSMAGHVRAPTAAGTRTTPTNEHPYKL